MEHRQTEGYVHRVPVREGGNAPVQVHGTGAGTDVRCR